MKKFLGFLRQRRAAILEAYESPLAFCQSLSSATLPDGLAAEAAAYLLELTPDVRDYAVASAYAVLIGSERRKVLSAYFTPPALAKAAITAAETFLAERPEGQILDPACGGGSFLVPIAEHLIRREQGDGRPLKELCARVVRRLRGLEIDPGLATLSEHLLTGMLSREFGYKRPKSSPAVRAADSLSVALDERFDLIVGNPPYGKVGKGADAAILSRAGSANIGGHTNLYGLFILRSLDWLKPGGGLVFIVPTSFVAGPYFSGLRQEILTRAQVTRIDHHEQREDLFIDAVQDVCLIVLRRRTLAREQRDKPYLLGWIDAAGTRHELGGAVAAADGEPWTLPVRVGAVATSDVDPDNKSDRSFVLADYGYRVRVGKVVPTRERDRLIADRSETSLPLVWASDVRPDGSFSFAATRRTTVCAWYEPLVPAPSYATRVSSVLVQRTSNRDQARRLNAAAVDSAFLAEHAERGFVAENHVIVLEVASETPAVSPQILAALLNSAVLNERFSAVSGSFSVSAKLLSRLALPDPGLLRVHDANGHAFDVRLREAFQEVPHILAPSKRPGNAQDSVDEAGNLLSSGTGN
ncbi:HsdM family class I SAM-dependent methyltransferase [Mesorhizobium delmotii]|uniref:site-specific DNA-methyltransferase (adenine-specific) n=1 Tax=Mesorhizobium delmotii TaxID=1631247 RepID=A0A2P9AAZ5_9HYPH|nr:N-6 DNA methylase [Mesorhizobium delmotii]SJM28270.1 putative restriction modification methylase [Mesorhizobium delmotii]